MKDKEISEGIKLIIQRMDSHPEEFDRLFIGGTNTKWDWLHDIIYDTNEFSKIMREADRHAIRYKASELLVNCIHKKAMKTLLGAEPHVELINTQLELPF